CPGEDRPLPQHLPRPVRLRCAPARVREPAQEPRGPRLQRPRRDLRHAAQAPPGAQGPAFPEPEGGGGRPVRVVAIHRAHRERARHLRRLLDARGVRVHALLGRRLGTGVRARRDERDVRPPQDRRGDRARRHRRGLHVRQELRAADVALHAESPPLMTDDALVPFVFEGAAVRGACVRMDRAVHDALASHDYPRALARVLAELLAASTLLAASLKFRGSLIVQLAGGGPVRLAVVECDHALSLRATAQWDPAAVARLGADATLAELAGGGGARLAITLDPEEGPLYQGIVALEAGSVATLL